MSLRTAWSAKSLRIETGRDFNGRFFLVWKPNVSMFFRDRKDMIRWIKWPKGTPTRASLDSWLDSMEADDSKKKGQDHDPVEEVDPAALDSSDPNYQTRVVI
jgi:hypothetical protein